MIYLVDIDGTLCQTDGVDYANRQPIPEAIAKVNRLYDDGHRIVIFTGRGAIRKLDYRELTEAQLKSWGVKYHELNMTKPPCDFIIDDKAISALNWLYGTSLLSMSTMPVKHAPKVWGAELHIVNCAEYCGKLLFVKKGAAGSCHMHPQKKETFFVLQGEIKLDSNDTTRYMTPETMPHTLLPNTPHKFRGLQDSVILEVSTHHDDTDVIRYDSSSAGENNGTNIS